MRVGGFGGTDGLTQYLLTEQIDAVVDATHPFAARMPHHATDACRTAAVPRVRLCRPPWQAAEGDRWHEVPDLDAAADFLVSSDRRRVFLTTGRQELEPFTRAADAWFLVRAIEPPASMPLPCATVVLARGPFREADERALMVEHRIDVLVAKNSGGTATAAKLAAARTLALPVVMITRPRGPGGPHVCTVEDVIAWLDGPANESAPA